MDRETFKILAYGQYAFTHLQDTIDKDQMQMFVNGALWAHDFVRKLPKEPTQPFTVLYPEVVYQKPDLDLCKDIL